MANESLNGLSVTIEQNTPQTLQEGVGLVSVVKEMNIAGTSEERIMSVSAVIGQAGDMKRCVILQDGASTQNQVVSSSIWMDRGIPKLIAQSGLENSQITI